MPHQEKKIKGRNTPLMMLLPITGTLLVKKVPQKKSEHTSINFHLDIINKIDKLLAEHEQKAPVAETFQAPPINPLQPPIPIEPRMPLNKTLAHQEIAWEPSLEQPKVTTQTIPEEFKTEINIIPEFRFITSHEFIETISQMPPLSDDRIEIIDLGTLVGDTPTSQKTTTFFKIKNQDNDIPPSTLQKNVENEEHHHKKIEVIDTRTERQKIYEEVCKAASQQAEQIEKKAQIYFINSKDHVDKKQKKLDIEQSYIPVDFDERSKQLKKQVSKEEEQKRQQQEKILKHQDHERDHFEKFESKRADFEGQKLEQYHKHVQVQKDRKISKKDIQHMKTARELKKEAKEQKRLQRLEMRQARIQEKRHQKEQKKALKLKLKQQHLTQKADEKELRQKGEKTTSRKKGKSASTPELDEDLKKVLRMTDSLLEHLPDDIIEQFVQSENFDVYQRVLNKYRVYERVMNKQRVK